MSAGTSFQPLSVRRYARWDPAETADRDMGPREASDAKVHAALAKSRTVIYTPPVKVTYKQLVTTSISS